MNHILAYKTNLNKFKRIEVGREVGLAGVRWRDGEKMQTIVTE